MAEQLSLVACGRVQWRLIGRALQVESVCLRDRHHDGKCAYETVEVARATETVAVGSAVL